MKGLLFLATALFSIESSARVLDFHSDIRVAQNGELTVTERITLEEPDAAPGLERDLPAGSRVVSVVRNGKLEPYSLDASGPGMRLRLGATASGGRHLYEITYRSRRQVRFLDSHDELRWSIEGAERLTAEVSLPGFVPARGIRAEAAGPEAQSLVRDARAAFRSKERLSIVLRFPKEVVAAPRLVDHARWFLADYFGPLLVLAGLGLTAAVLARLRTLSARG